MSDTSCKKQELLTLREHLGSPPVFGEVRVAHFIFLCDVFVICLSSSCVLCAQCCQCLWIVHSRLPLRFSQMFIYKKWSCLCHQTVIGIKVLLIKIHCIFEYYTRDYIHVLIIRHIYWTICENFTCNFCLYSQTQRKSTSVLLYRCYFKMSSVIRYYFCTTLQVSDNGLNFAIWRISLWHRIIYAQYPQGTNECFKLGRYKVQFYNALQSIKYYFNRG